jgi:hypothetical protein
MFPFRAVISGLPLGVKRASNILGLDTITKDKHEESYLLGYGHGVFGVRNIKVHPLGLIAFR